MLKKVILWSLVAFGLYLLVSYFCLNGRLTYTTSFCSHNKLDSRQRKLLIKDNLKIEFDQTNLILKKIIDENDIWIEKHFDIKYFGLLFYRKIEDTNYQKIRFECKNVEACEQKVCDIIIENDTIEKSTLFPNSQMAVKVGKAVEYNVYEYYYGKTISVGKLKIETK